MAELFARLRHWQVIRPDAVTVWHDPEVVERLSWYYAVMRDEAPAKYHICARIEVPEKIEDLWNMPIEDLWKLHDKYAEEADKVWRELRTGCTKDEYIKWTSSSLPSCSVLDVKIVLAKRIVSSCIFCERKCRVNRYERRGACLTTAKPRIGTYFHHLGEEAPLVPSGTIFFTGCTFRCVFCQNWDISQFPDNGDEVTPKQLAIIQKWLRENGARNINWVGGDPTPAIHAILESLKYLAEWGVNVPQLWNSNMYLTVEGMKLILHVMDIWLPDMKYGNDRCAERYSIVKRYWEVITRNMKMLADRGEDCIIRHLVMPSHVECCTKPVLEWIAKNYKKALVNIMDQYRPEWLVAKYPHRWPEIARRPSSKELNEAYEYARKLGICWEPVTR